MPIRLDDLKQRRGEVKLTYFGEELNVVYNVNHITKEFRAESLRLAREGLRIQRRQEELIKQIQSIVAADGTPEAQEENAEAEQAIAKLDDDDKILKRQIDGILANTLLSWDLLQDDGTPVPITAEELFPLPADFEKSILEAVMEATNLGEASGQRSMKTLPTSLPRKAKQAI